MSVVVLTSDNHNWLLRGFFHQWDKYDGREIEVMGFTDPGPGVRGGHRFVSMGEFKDYPVDRWSDAVIAYLQTLHDDFIEIWLEDYWLIRHTNQMAVKAAALYMQTSPDVIRFDLATDRMYAHDAMMAGAFLFLDLVEAKGQYSLSFQASLWNRAILLEMMRDGESPWEAELDGSGRLNASPYRVVGSLQGPVRYHIAMNKGKFDRKGAWMFPPRTLCTADWAELDRLGYTTHN